MQGRDRVAFVVLAHDDVAMFSRLLADLAPHPVYFHLDRAAPVAPFVEAIRASPAPVVVNPERVCVHWAGFSVLRAMLGTLAVALESGRSAETYVFVSGHCLALRPIAEFVDFLDSTPPVHCRAYRLLPGGPIGQSLDRVERRHAFDGPMGHLAKQSPFLLGGVRRRLVYPALAGLHRPLPDVVHACGSQWTAMPHDLAVELVAAYRRGDFDYLRDAYASDELALPTYVYARPQWAALTQTGRLDEVPREADVSWIPNFHHLRPGLHGYLDAAELGRGRAAGRFFARKVRSAELRAIPGAGVLPA